MCWLTGSDVPGFFSRDPQTSDEHDHASQQRLATISPPIDQVRTPGKKTPLTPYAEMNSFNMPAEPHPRYFQAPYNNIAAQYASNRCALSPNFLMVGQPYMTTPRRSPSPFADSMQRVTYQDHKLPSPPGVAEPDVPPRCGGAAPATEATPVQVPAPTKPDIADVVPEVTEPIPEVAKPILEASTVSPMPKSTRTPRKAMAVSRVKPEPSMKPEEPSRPAQEIASPEHQSESEVGRQEPLPSPSGAPDEMSDYARRLTCPICDALFASKTQLVKHQKTPGRCAKKKISAEKSDTPPPRDREEMSEFARRLTCSACNVMFPTRTQLVKHMDTSSCSRGLVAAAAHDRTCSTCGSVFKSRKRLLTHLKTMGLCPSLLVSPSHPLTACSVRAGPSSSSI